MEKLNAAARAAIDWKGIIYISTIYHRLRPVQIIIDYARVKCIYKFWIISSLVFREIWSGHPFCYHGLYSIPLWIRDYMHYKLWDAIAY